MYALKAKENEKLRIICYIWFIICIKYLFVARLYSYIVQITSSLVPYGRTHTSSQVQVPNQ